MRPPPAKICRFANMCASTNPSRTRPLAALMAFFPTLDRPSSLSLDMRRTSMDQSYGMVHFATTLIK